MIVYIGKVKYLKLYITLAYLKATRELEGLEEEDFSKN